MFGIRVAHRSTWPRALAFTALGFALATVSFVVVAPAGAATGPVVARTSLYFEGEFGSALLDSASLSFPTIATAVAEGTDVLSFAVALDGHAWTVSFAKPTGSPWAPGTYEHAERTTFRGPGKPGFDLSGDGRGCNTVDARFIVDEVALNGDGSPQVFSARFEHHCDGLEPAVFGALSFNSAMPYRTHTVPYLVGMPDQVTGTVGPSQPITVANDGPDTLAVGPVVLGGDNAAAYQVDGNGCTAMTLGPGESCVVTVVFHPTGPLGYKPAKLTVFDDLAPPGGTGRDVFLQGRAVSPPVSTGELTPLTPTRVFDTRDGTGGQVGPIGPMQTREVLVTGLAGVPATGASAVIANVTAVAPDAASHLSVFPAGNDLPNVSNLNFVAGQTVANLVTVPVGAGGKIAVHNNAGNTHVLVDVVGFYANATGPAGARFHSIEPRRILDRRDGTGNTGVGKVGAQQEIRLDVTGAGGTPEGGVKAVVLNVTVTGPTAASHLTVYPGDVPRPVASNLNFVAGQTVPNLVVIEVPDDGIVTLYNQSGAVFIIADVTGYFDLDRSTNAGRFMPLTPTRLVDTRDVPQPLEPNSAAVLYPSGFRGVPFYPGYSALILNVTAIAPTTDGWIAVFPTDAQLLEVSNLNFKADQPAVPNLVMTDVSTFPVQPPGLPVPIPPGSIGIYNVAGYTHLAIDTFGYFT